MINRLLAWIDNPDNMFKCIPYAFMLFVGSVTIVVLVIASTPF